MHSIFDVFPGAPSSFYFVLEFWARAELQLYRHFGFDDLRMGGFPPAWDHVADSAAFSSAGEGLSFEQ